MRRRPPPPSQPAPEPKPEPKPRMGSDSYVPAMPVKAAKPGAPADAAWLAYVASVRESLDWFEQASQNLQSTMRLLQFVLDVHKQPLVKRLEALQTLRQDHAQVARLVLQRVTTDPGLLQRIGVTLDRYYGAAEIVREYARALANAETRPALRASLPRDLAVSRLKGKLYMLTNLDLLFKDDPVLNRLFPPRPREESGELERKLKPAGLPPGSVKLPARPTLSAPQAAKPPPGGLVAKLKEVLKRLEEAEPT